MTSHTQTPTMTMRHQGIFNPTIRKITVVGAGGIGSPTVLMLAKMGFKNIEVYDNDTVDEVNIGSQLYQIPDIGKQKVDALKEQVSAFAGIEIVPHNKKTDGKGILTSVLILAVDCIETRREIAENAMYDYLVDGRMGGETYSVIYCPSPLRENYITEHIFPKEEAAPVACSERAVAYNTFGCASLICSTIKRINNNEEVPGEQHFCFVNRQYIQA